MESKKLNFIIPEIKDIPTLTSNAGRYYDGILSCEVSPVVLLMWNRFYSYKYAVYDGMLFLLLDNGSNPIFFIPFADDMRKALDILFQYAEENGINPRFIASSGERLEQFRILEPSYTVTPVRDDFEYIYSREKLVNLSGKHYHGKRGHISAFSQKYNWVYEEMNDGNLTDIIKAADSWLELAETEFEDYESAEEENKGIKRILPFYKQLGIRGGVIRIDGDIAAFTFGSPINKKVFDVNVEKTMPRFRDAYPVINQQFVKNTLDGFEFINREDDMGLPNLRKAKLSYRPEILLEKFLVQKV